MFVKDQIPIGHKEDTELFNNVGYIEGMEGRLKVVLNIQPVPELYWDFELLNQNDISYFWNISKENNESICFLSKNLEIEIAKPHISYIHGSSSQVGGSAQEILFGDPNQEAEYFECYFTNANFLRNAFGITSGDTALKESEFKELLSLLNNELNSLSIDRFWKLSISTNLKSLEWLKPGSKNRGSIISAKLSLSRNNMDLHSGLSQGKSLNEARNLFLNLCLMLSYANGGYISPSYIVAKNNSKDGLEKISASTAIVSINSPQEDIGKSFVRPYGIKDLAKYINCFSEFNSMLNKKHWREKWFLILEWYFQAIPRLGGRKKNFLVSSVEREYEGNAREVLLSINANVLGSLLENLSYLILVEDKIQVDGNEVSKRDFKKMKPDRLKIVNLMKAISIDNEDDNIEVFSGIRNNSTHAEPTPEKIKGKSFNEQKHIVDKAIQWVDEVILARIGYESFYLNRSAYSVSEDRASYSDSGIQPRYTLPEIPKISS